MGVSYVHEILLTFCIVLETGVPLDAEKSDRPNAVVHDCTVIIMRWSKATVRLKPAEGTNPLCADLRFLSPPVMVLCAHFVNGMTVRELLK